MRETVHEGNRDNINIVIVAVVLKKALSSSLAIVNHDLRLATRQRLARGVLRNGGRS